jgi:hypothetical protein
MFYHENITILKQHLLDIDLVFLSESQSIMTENFNEKEINFIFYLKRDSNFNHCSVIRRHYYLNLKRIFMKNYNKTKFFTREKWLTR